MFSKQKLPLSVLKKILKDYNLGKIKKIEPLVTSGNITFLISSKTGKFILRLCPKGIRKRSKKEILAELELIDYLLKNNFSAPIPVLKNDGTIIIKWENQYGYLRKFEEGQSILNPSSKQIEIFGRKLGEFHKLIKGYKTKNPRHNTWDLKEIKKQFQANKKIILNSNFKNADQFVKKIENELSKLYFPDNLPSGMIHEDLGKRHILWQKNKIKVIIDFDRCYYGKLVLDLGQACRGWCFIKNWSTWSNKNLKTLLKAYGQKRKLTNLEKKYLFNAIKFAVLERGSAFSFRYLNETQNKKDEKFAWHSIDDNKGLLGMLNKNKKEIENIIKIA